MFNVIIKNGTVIDGTGNPRYRADVGIKNGKIADIGDLSNELTEESIDARGQLVVPGFIDVNNHSDTYWRIFATPTLDSLVRQGITTIIGGNCGSSLAPLVNKDIIQSIQKWVDVSNFSLNWLRMGEFLDEVERKQLSVNFGTLVGHGTLRRGITHDENRLLNEVELESAKKMLKDALREGALGMSSGLIYTHARSATREELIQLAEVVSKNDGVYATHVRGESRGLTSSIEEAIEVAKQSGVKLHISHLKAMGEHNWPLMDSALHEIEKAADQGVEVTFDVYPYTATGSVLYTLLPDWVSEGGKRMMIHRLQDQKIRSQVVKEMQENETDYSKIRIALSPLNKGLARQKISDIAADQGKSVEEVVIDILLASGGRVVTSMEVLSEKNVTAAIHHPLSMVASNGAGYSLDHRATGELVHPRNFGSFPKFLGTYVRDLKLLKWEEAIHKVTGKPAKKFNIPKRGVLRKGNFADVAVIHPKKIQSAANIENPYQYPEGVNWVLVNGEIVVQNGVLSGARPGKVIRKSHLFF